jgi:hypothetical protein
MGLPSLSNLAICIKKAEFSGFKAGKSDFKGDIVSKIQFRPTLKHKKNGIELSMEKKDDKFFWLVDFSVFVRHNCISL